jgi:hypothetical protein
MIVLPHNASTSLIITMLQNTTQEGYIYFTQLATGCVVHMFIYLFICGGEGMLQE